MSGKYLLDTNTVIRLFKDDSAVVNEMAAADLVCLSCIVIGELLYGARNSARVGQNLAQVHELVDLRPVLNCDLETAEMFGQIKSALRAKGRPIPENDIWIAAHASQYQLTLVTDDHHFQQVDGIALESW